MAKSLAAIRFVKRESLASGNIATFNGFSLFLIGALQFNI